MKVEELIIDGFKSYATRTVISDWDPQFNAITGLNGSGKSNILDAICFVLGIASMSTVRASNLQDLIYKRGQAGVTKASVTIVFDNNEVSKSPIGFENTAKISVTRQIILGGSSKYLINGHKAQQQTVLNLFQSVQLNINNPNFLIMQGKITKVLNMKPSEILSLIEEAAGTRTFEERKERAQKTMAKKESKLVEIRTLLKEEIEPKLEKLRVEKRNFLEYQQIRTDLEKMSRVSAAYDYLHYSEKFNDHSKFLNERESIMANANSEVEKLNDEIQNLNSDLEEVKRKRDKEMKKDGRIESLETAEVQLSDAITRANTSIEITTDNMKEELKQRKKLEERAANLEDSLGNNLDLHKVHENQFKDTVEQLSLLKDEFTKKEELLSTLSTGISSKGGAEGGYMSQLKDAKDKLAETTNSTRQSELKIKHLSEKLNDDSLKRAKQENTQLLKSVESHVAVINEKEQHLSGLGYDGDKIAHLKKEDQRLQNEISRLNNDLNAMRRDLGGIEFSYTPPPNFDESLVRGTAAQLFTLADKAIDKALALQVCAGGRLYNVVVETSEAGAQLLEKGKLRKRITIIPLDKINTRVIGDQLVNAAKELRPGKVDLALNMVEFEEDLTKAMQYIFGNTFICNDPETAKAVTFHPKIRSRSITTDGDVYDPEGNLSGGSRKNTSSILIAMQRFNRLTNELRALEQESNNIRSQLAGFEKLGAKTNDLRREIDLNQHELQLLNRKLENSPSAIIIKEHEKVTKEIEDLRNQIAADKKRAESYREEIKSIEVDMKEFSSDKGSKLKKLQKEVENLRGKLVDKQQEKEERTAQFQSAEIENEQIKADLKSVKESIENSSQYIREMEESLSQHQNEIASNTEKLTQVKAELEEEKSNLLGLSEEVKELNEILTAKNSKINTLKLEIQKMNHELEKSSSLSRNLKNHLDALIKENDWVTDSQVVESIIQKYPNVNLDECHEQQALLEEKHNSLKRKVNTNIMSMIDNVEKKEASLKHMVKTIEKDKAKIVKTVDKLNGYKRDTLNTTYQKVSVDFGQIFADLLPGSFAKLVPVEQTDVTKGLEVKVKLGEVWKESLVELSGGQRSLIALSLIMALLQFKPAPMYILDEVDAALDLSHTQNIGHLIKTRFHGSQFIVVSLKEGMFTNANRIFRTRFQDGTSVVSRM